VQIGDVRFTPQERTCSSANVCKVPLSDVAALACLVAMLVLACEANLSGSDEISYRFSIGPYTNA
jgi:hypothetical protein